MSRFSPYVMRNMFMSERLITPILWIATLMTTLSVAANEKRFEFAHSYLGLGIQALPAIKTDNGNGDTLNFPSRSITRMSWGGLHFWNHVDFELTIPISGFENTVGLGNETVKSHFTAGSSYGLSTNFYPFPLEKGSLRPFVGFGFFSGFSYQQGSDLSDSPIKTSSMFYTPIKVGVSYRNRHWMYELGAQKLPSNQFEYYTSRDDVQSVEFDSAHAYFTTKYVWESSKNDKRAKSLLKKSFAWTLGFGPSAASELDNFEYNQTTRPWLDSKPYKNAEVFPELSAGIFFYDPEIQVALAYRNIKAEQKEYGIQQNYERQSLTLEAFKYLFDYHGFNPFVGVNVSRDQYSIRETDEGVATISESEARVSPGITFGWDIVPVGRERLIMRTNLRWSYHGSDIFKDADYHMSASQIEFNLIHFLFSF